MGDWCMESVKVTKSPDQWFLEGKYRKAVQGFFREKIAKAMKSEKAVKSNRDILIDIRIMQCQLKLKVYPTVLKSMSNIAQDIKPFVNYNGEVKIKFVEIFVEAVRKYFSYLLKMDMGRERRDMGSWQKLLDVSMASSEAYEGKNTAFAIIDVYCRYILNTKDYVKKLGELLDNCETKELSDTCSISIEHLMDEDISAFMTAVKSAGFKIYLSGSAVRDMLLGFTSSNWDFVTNMPHDKLLKLELKNNNNGDPIGLKDASNSLSITLKLTSPNSPSKRLNITVDKDLTDEFSWFNKLSSKKVFTTNAMFTDGKLLADPFFVGFIDTLDRRLNPVNEELWLEDHSNLMRYFRFQCELGFKGEIDLSKHNKSFANVMYILEYSDGPKAPTKLLAETRILANLLPNLQKALERHWSREEVKTVADIMFYNWLVYALASPTKGNWRFALLCLAETSIVKRAKGIKLSEHGDDPIREVLSNTQELFSLSDEECKDISSKLNWIKTKLKSTDLGNLTPVTHSAAETPKAACNKLKTDIADHCAILALEHFNPAVVGTTEKYLSTIRTIIDQIMMLDPITKSKPIHGCALLANFADITCGVLGNLPPITKGTNAGKQISDSILPIMNPILSITRVSIIFYGIEIRRAKYLAEQHDYEGASKCLTEVAPITSSIAWLIRSYLGIQSNCMLRLGISLTVEGSETIDETLMSKEKEFRTEAPEEIDTKLTWIYRQIEKAKNRYSEHQKATRVYNELLEHCTAEELNQQEEKRNRFLQQQRQKGNTQGGGNPPDNKGGEKKREYKEPSRTGSQAKTLEASELKIICNHKQQSPEFATKLFKELKDKKETSKRTKLLCELYIGDCYWTQANKIFTRSYLPVNKLIAAPKRGTPYEQYNLENQTNYDLFMKYLGEYNTAIDYLNSAVDSYEETRNLLEEKGSNFRMLDGIKNNLKISIKHAKETKTSIEKEIDKAHSMISKAREKALAKQAERKANKPKEKSNETNINKKSVIPKYGNLLKSLEELQSGLRESHKDSSTVTSDGQSDSRTFGG